jgi:hypothetical protein
MPDTIRKEIAFIASVDTNRVVSALAKLQEQLAGMGKGAGVLSERVGSLMEQFRGGTATAEQLANAISELEADAQALEVAIGDAALVEPYMDAAKALKGELSSALGDAVEKAGSAAEAVLGIGKAIEITARVGAELPEQVVKSIDSIEYAANGLLDELGDVSEKSLEEIEAALNHILDTAEELGTVTGAGALAAALAAVGEELQTVAGETDETAKLMAELDRELMQATDHTEGFSGIAERVGHAKEAFGGIAGAVKEASESNIELSETVKGIASVYAPSIERLQKYGEILESTGLKEKALQRLHEGMSSVVQAAATAYKESGNSVIGFARSLFTAETATKALKAGLASTGIGLLAIALGVVIANLDKITAWVKDFIDKVGFLKDAVNVVLDFAAALGLAEKREIRDAREGIAKLNRQLLELQRTAKASPEALKESLEREAELRKQQLDNYAAIIAEQRKAGKKANEEDLEEAEKTITALNELYGRELEEYKSTVEAKQSLLESLGVSTVEQEAQILNAERETLNKRIALLEDFAQKSGQLTDEQRKELAEYYAQREQLDARAALLEVKRKEEIANREIAALDRRAKVLAADGRSTYAIEVQKLKIQRKATEERIKLITAELEQKQKLTEEDRKQLEQAKDQLKEIDAEIRARAIERANEIRDALRDVQQKTLDLLGAGAGELAGNLADIAKQSVQTLQDLERQRDEYLRRFGRNSKVYQAYLTYIEQATAAARVNIAKQYKELGNALREIVTEAESAIRELNANIIEAQQGIAELQTEIISPEQSQAVANVFDAARRGYGALRDVMQDANFLLIDAGDTAKRARDILAGVVRDYTEFERQTTAGRVAAIERRKELALKRLAIDYESQRATLEREQRQLTEQLAKQEQELAGLQQQAEEITKQLANARQRVRNERDARTRAEIEKEITALEEQQTAIQDLTAKGAAAFERLQRARVEAAQKAQEQITLLNERQALEQRKIEQEAEQQKLIEQETAKQRAAQLEIDLQGYREYSSERLSLERQILESQLRVAQATGASSEEVANLLRQLKELEMKEAVAPLMQISEGMQTIGEFTSAAADSVGQFFDVFTKQGRSSKVYKAFAVADVLAKTAQSIMNAVLVAQQGAIGSGPLAPFTFATFLASQLGAVFSAIAQIREILDVQISPPEVETPEFDWGAAVANMQNAMQTRQTVEAGLPTGDLRVYVLDSDIVGVRERNNAVVKGSTIT